LKDDDLLQIEGNIDKVMGKVLEDYGIPKDDIISWVDKWYQGKTETG
jgi:uncharacterized protein YjbJ (UPF0337 family)